MASDIVETSHSCKEAERFPVFPVCEHWGDAAESTLVQEYIEWIVPSLLSLQHLSLQQRACLE